MLPRCKKSLALSSTQLLYPDNFTFYLASISCFFSNSYLITSTLKCLFSIHQHHLEGLDAAGQFCMNYKNQKELIQWDDSWSFSWHRQVDSRRMVGVVVLHLEVRKYSERLCDLEIAYVLQTALYFWFEKLKKKKNIWKLAHPEKPEIKTNSLNRIKNRIDGCWQHFWLDVIVHQWCVLCSHMHVENTLKHLAQSLLNQKDT